MVEHNARIVLSNEAHELIRWFTLNHDKEIGATGTVSIKQRDGEKYFYVEKLFFPKQYNTSALVHFGPEHWKDIIMQCNMEELAKMNFYWHKHPGSAAHSGTDEEDTFDTFMSREANRKFFIFLQTAKDSNGELDTEARIDLRLPIRTTILKDKIKMMYEFSAEEKKLMEIQDMKDKKIGAFCSKLIEDVKLDVPPISVSEREKETTKEIGWKYPVVERDNIFQTIVKGVKGLFNVEEEIKYMDNDMLVGYSTKIEEKASLQFINGSVKITGGKLFQKIIDDALVEKGQLTLLVGHIKARETDSTKIYHLQPKKGGYNNLCEKVGEIFIEFNKALIEKHGISDKTDNVDLKINEKYFSVRNNHKLVAELIGDLVSEQFILFEWHGDKNARVMNAVKDQILGHIYLHESHDNALFSGSALINKIKLTEAFKKIQPVDLKGLNYKGNIKKEAKK